MKFIKSFYRGISAFFRKFCLLYSFKLTTVDEVDFNILFFIFFISCSIVCVQLASHMFLKNWICVIIVIHVCICQTMYQGSL